MRMFIGVRVGEQLTARLAVELRRLAPLAPNARWVRPASLHLSLAFLGEVPDALVPRLGDALARVAAQAPAHSLRAGGGGTFGPLDCPKVLWVGLSDADDALVPLQRILVRELAELGLAPDHATFVPHVTLSRARNPRGDPALGRCADALQHSDFGDLPVREVILFASETDRSGMHYRALVTQPLKESELLR